jgi:3-oxoacyl-[acyl-carrier protein] reductase
MTSSIPSETPDQQARVERLKRMEGAKVAPLAVYLLSDAAADITGQAIGIGGDRLSLWTHPTQAVAAYADGGWSADAIAEVWPTIFADHQQSVGEKLPEPPKEAS